MSGLRWGDQPFVRPSVSQALEERSVFDAALSGEFGNCASGAIRSVYERVVTNVVHLLFRCGPPAILGLIVAVGVDAIEAVFLARRATHVLKEGFIALTPSVADGDSPRAIDSVLRFCGSIAAGLHPKPCSVLLCGTATLAMRFLRLPASLITQAAATLRGLGTQGTSEYQFFVAAVADAIPSYELTSMRPLRFDN